MKAFERRSARTVYENPWLRFEAHEIAHPNGTPGEHGLVVTPSAVAVVVVDGDDVVLARQSRFAAEREVVEVVKGGASAGESPLDAARRETREELGVEAAAWDDLGSIDEIPSIVAPPVRLFLAREISAVATEPEAVESIVAVRMPFDDAFFAAASGELTDAVTATALLRVAYRIRRSL